MNRTLLFRVKTGAFRQVVDTELVLYAPLIHFFFILFRYIKLHVGFYNEKGILVTCTLKTAGEYLKTSFLFDFLAVIPFDLMMISYHGNFKLLLSKLLCSHYGYTNDDDSEWGRVAPLPRSSVDR